MPENPIDGWREIAEIQSRALAAAAAAVERIVGSGGNGAGSIAPRDLRRMRAEAERMLELASDSARVLLDAVFDFVEQPGGTADVACIGPVASGAKATAELFLHVL